MYRQDTVAPLPLQLCSSVQMCKSRTRSRHSQRQTYQRRKQSTCCFVDSTRRLPDCTVSACSRAPSNSARRGSLHTQSCQIRIGKCRQRTRRTRSTNCSAPLYLDRTGRARSSQLRKPTRRDTLCTRSDSSHQASFGRIQQRTAPLPLSLLDNSCRLDIQVLAWYFELGSRIQRDSARRTTMRSGIAPPRSQEYQARTHMESLWGERAIQSCQARSAIAALRALVRLWSGFTLVARLQSSTGMPAGSVYTRVPSSVGLACQSHG